MRRAGSQLLVPFAGHTNGGNQILYVRPYVSAHLHNRLVAEEGGKLIGHASCHDVKDEGARLRQQLNDLRGR